VCSLERDVLSSGRVLVTGGAGFIGSTLIRRLVPLCEKVIVFDNFVSGSRKNLEGFEQKVDIVEGDICDQSFHEILDQQRVAFLFHLAAHPFIPSCYDEPLKFFNVNSLGTMNVLLAAKRARVKRIVLFSTSEVYGTAQYVPMDENHPLDPSSTYAVSKCAADRLAQTFFYEHNLPLTIVRQFNCYGPRETHPYIIPEIISQLSKSRVIELGNTAARRDFTYVDDAADAAISIAACKEAIGEVFNVGSGNDISIMELAHLIGELMGVDDVEIQRDPIRLRPKDVERLYCDASKVSRLTGWMPKMRLREGLEHTIDWYKKNSFEWPYHSNPSYAKCS